VQRDSRHHGTDSILNQVKNEKIDAPLTNLFEVSNYQNFVKQVAPAISFVFFIQNVNPSHFWFVYAIQQSVA